MIFTGVNRLFRGVNRVFIGVNRVFRGVNMLFLTWYDPLNGELARCAGAPYVGRVIVDQVLEGGGEVPEKRY